jgi:hypothetical protein
VLHLLEISSSDPKIINERTLLHQILYSDFMYRYKDGDFPKGTDQLSCYLWFVSFAYRLRNAIFHEIIDPLNEKWQKIANSNIQFLQQK